MSDKPKHQPRRVVYVDKEGRHLQARTMGEPGIDGKTLLLVGNGRGGMATVEAAESGGKALGTWHAPDQPS